MLLWLLSPVEIHPGSYQSRCCCGGCRDGVVVMWLSWRIAIPPLSFHWRSSSWRRIPSSLLYIRVTHTQTHTQTNTRGWFFFHWRSDTLSLSLCLHGGSTRRNTVIVLVCSYRALFRSASLSWRHVTRNERFPVDDPTMNETRGRFTTIRYDTAFSFCYSSYWRLLLMLIIVAVPPVPSTTWSNHWPYPVGYRPYIVCGVLDNCQSLPIVSPPNSWCDSSSSYGNCFYYFWHRMLLPLCQ